MQYNVMPPLVLIMEKHVQLSKQPTNFSQMTPRFTSLNINMATENCNYHIS